MTRWLRVSMVLALGLLAGCNEGAREQSTDDGIDISFPGGSVRIGDEGVKVEAPGVDVDVNQDKVGVKAPNVDVEVNKK